MKNRRICLQKEGTRRRRKEENRKSEVSDQKSVFGHFLGGWVAQEEENMVRLLVVEEVARWLYKKKYIFPKRGGAKTKTRKIRDQKLVGRWRKKKKILIAYLLLNK